MNKKISLGAAVAFMLIVAAATFSLTMIYSQDLFNSKMNDLTARLDQYDKFSEIEDVVKSNYNGTINNNQLMDSVAKGYIAGIGDEYADYITAEEYQRLLLEQQGDNVGIGAVLEVGTDGYLLVQEVYADSPAQLVGIEAGDLIVKVGDTDLTQENSSQMLASISGAQGTTVSLMVRKGREDVQVEPIRRQVVAPSVESKMVGSTSVGYLWIKEFDDNTSDQFTRELQRLLDAGAASLIIDLRDNPGGSLRSAVRILDKLLPAGNLVSVSADREGLEYKVLHTSDANEIDLPMVVITNAGTAGEAEIFAQNLKDYDNKGRIVGATTAGQGVMQELIQLSDGSAVNLTVAYYLTASGESFHGIGVRPDYEVSLEGDWRALNELTDNQLIKAIEVAQSMEKTLAVREQQTEEPDQPSNEGTEEPDRQEAQE